MNRSLALVFHLMISVAVGVRLGFRPTTTLLPCSRNAASRRAMFRQTHRSATSTSCSSEDAAPRKQRVRKKSYKMSSYGRAGSSRGTLCTTHSTKNTPHPMQTDTPKIAGGTDFAPQPVELLLASLSGCATATAKFVFKNWDWEDDESVVIESLSFDIEAWRDQTGVLTMPLSDDPPVPSMLQSVAGTVKVRTVPFLPTEKLQPLAHAVETRCPVANMLTLSGCDLDLRVRPYLILCDSQVVSTD